MSKLLALVGATLGGAVGWWLGAFIGLMTAFMLSMIGTGLGVYAGRRFATAHPGPALRDAIGGDIGLAVGTRAARTGPVPGLSAFHAVRSRCNEVVGR